VKPLDILMAVAVPLIWGMGIVFAKAAINHFPPILLMGFRFLLTAAVLVWFVRPPWHLMREIFWIALVSAAIQYSLTFTGLAGLDASTAALVVQAEVPFGALLAWIVFKDRLGWRRAFGMLVAFVGIAIIAGRPQLAGSMPSVALMLAGAFSWAVGQVMVKRLGHVGGFTLIAWVAVVATPQLFIASWIFEEGQLEAIRSAGPLVWAVVAYLGLVMTAVGYAMWYRLLGFYDVTQVMPFLLLIPVAGVVGGVVVLGESLTAALVLGGAIVIAGVACIVVEPASLRARREAGR
jgi:O-acetylserine/cysteine efflux transporter